MPVSLNQLAKSLWSARREFFRYFVIGFSAFIFDIGTLYALKEFGHLSPVVAVMVNQPPILVYVFFLNKHWSFRSTGITHQQLVRFLLLTGANYLFAIAWIWFWHHTLGINYLIARVANIILAVGWNFFLYKYWVYRVTA